MTKLSVWEARKQVQLRGFGVTYGQFKDYQSRGLLRGEEGGRWPEGVVGQLAQIHELGKSVRSLHRRVVRLRADFVDFPIPSRKVREAMVLIANEGRSFRSRKRKMKRIDEAVCRWAARQAAANPGAIWVHDADRRWSQPDSSTWASVLSDSAIDDRLFDERLSLQYHQDAILAIETAHGAVDLSGIPLDERIVLLTIRDLSLWLHREITNQLWEEEKEQPAEDARKHIAKRMPPS